VNEPHTGAAQSVVEPVLKLLYPEPEPKLSFLTGSEADQEATAKLMLAFLTRFRPLEAGGMSGWCQQNLGVDFGHVMAARIKQRQAMTLAAVDRFTNRLRELQTAGQLTDDGVMRAIRSARVQIVLHYTDAEALDALRAMCQDGQLTARQQGLILHLLPLHPDTYKLHAQELTSQAQDLLNANRQREAVDLLDAACELAPNSAQMVLRVANLLAAQGEVKRALHRLEVGFPLFPDCWEIPYNAACYHCRTGDLQMAVRCLARAVQVNPAEASASAANDPDLLPLRRSDLKELLGQSLASARGPSETTAPAPKVVTGEWYYSADSKVVLGPVAVRDLKELIRTGRVTPDTLISRDGKTWSQASRLKGVEWPRV
jgi:tetratricopeptide (TPR) repeat protein